MDDAFRSMETYHVVYTQKYSLTEGDWDHVRENIVSDYDTLTKSKHFLLRRKDAVHQILLVFVFCQKS